MRACLRCISKKRKASEITLTETKTMLTEQCDHQQPTCSLCEKAREDCTYPSETYRRYVVYVHAWLSLTAWRGPIAGYVKIVEQRLEELESALSFVLAQEGVRKVFCGPRVSFLLHASVSNLIP